MKKKVLLMFLVITLAVLMVVGCAEDEPDVVDEPDDDEIVIGSVMDLTGGLGPMGEKIAESVKLAIHEINEAGGVNGKQLRLIMEDGATEAATALEGVKKLVEVNGAKFIIGPMTTGANDTVGPYVSERGVLLITPSATGVILTGREYRDFVFRTCMSDDFQGVIMAELAAEEGVETAVIITMDNPYGVGLGDVVKEALADQGIEVIGNITYDENKLDYLAELTEIARLDPDAVMHVGYNEDAKVVYRQALELGLENMLWVGPDGVHGSGTLEDPSAASFMEQAVIGTRPMGDPESPAYLDFAASYEEFAGYGPDVFGDTAYDAVHLLALAMKKAGSEDPAEVRDALIVVGQNYEGASGTITFSEGGDRVSGRYEVWAVKDGENVHVRIIE